MGLWVAALHQVGHLNVSVFCQIFIDGKVLNRQLSRVSKDKHLQSGVFGVDSQDGANGEGSCFTSSIFRLSYQMVVRLLDYHGDSDCLDLGGLLETKFVGNVLDNLRRYLK